MDKGDPNLALRKIALLEKRNFTDKGKVYEVSVVAEKNGAALYYHFGSARFIFESSKYHIECEGGCSRLALGARGTVNMFLAALFCEACGVPWEGARDIIKEHSRKHTQEISQTNEV
jgi:hypothetical protein